MHSVESVLGIHLQNTYRNSVNHTVLYLLEYKTGFSPL